MVIVEIYMYIRVDEAFKVWKLSGSGIFNGG